ADIDKLARKTAVEFAHLGVTADKAYESVAAIAKALNSTMGVTEGLVESISIMSTSLGVSATEAANFVKSLGVIGRSTAEAQKNMMHFAGALSEAAGVPLRDVMADVVSSAKSAY